MKINFKNVVFAMVFVTISVAIAAKTENFDGSRFFNPWAPSMDKSFVELLRWQLFGDSTPWPESRENEVVAKLSDQVAQGQWSTTFINHATHLIQLKGFNFLTDPIFSERASPVQWAGPKRIRKPALLIKDLPKIDFVLISHNHYDHMDSASIQDLAKIHNPIFIVPLANGELIQGMGAEKVVELDWWQEHQVVNSEFKITLVPAQHWSARGVFDRNKALWGGFVIQSQKFKIYFAGDTGYGDFFKEIRKKLGPMSLSLLPIGAYEPRWFMKGHHMNPAEAVMAHKDLESKFSLGTHFGTFKLTDEGVDDPEIALTEALNEMGVSSEAFIAPQVGETHTR